jgi:1,4-dihydroxy-2-naphthoyl-CoA hydrolase
MLCSMPGDLDALIALMPFAGHLGLVLDEASPDRVIARLDWAPHLCTSGGLMHGGVLMSLADTAGALVTFVGLPLGAATATITSTSQLFRPVSKGTVRAVAVPLHRGRTTVTAQTSLYDSEERLVAQTTQIQAVRAPVA